MSARAKQMVSEYTDVFSGLGLIKTNATIHIHSCIPSVVDPPKRIPHAIHNQVKQELDCMLKLGVIAEHQPTEWVNSTTIVCKPGKLRICLDPTKLNKAVHRGAFQTKTIDDIIACTVDAKFSVLDAKSGY